MMIFAKLSSSYDSLVLGLEIFTLNSDKSNRNRNIGNSFSRYSSEAHFLPGLQNSTNLMWGM